MVASVTVAPKLLRWPRRVPGRAFALEPLLRFAFRRLLGSAPPESGRYANFAGAHAARTPLFAPGPARLRFALVPAYSGLRPARLTPKQLASPCPSAWLGSSTPLRAVDGPRRAARGVGRGLSRPPTCAFGAAPPPTPSPTARPPRHPGGLGCARCHYRHIVVPSLPLLDHRPFGQACWRAAACTLDLTPCPSAVQPSPFVASSPLGCAPFPRPPRRASDSLSSIGPARRPRCPCRAPGPGVLPGPPFGTPLRLCPSLPLVAADTARSGSRFARHIGRG